MSRKSKKSKRILFLIEQLIFTFTEKTPLSVKYSERNKLVAQAASSVNQLSKHISKKSKSNQ